MPKDTFFNLKTDKQERILRAAINEFQAHGFVAANIGIIAKNAEVAKGSMYQYFEDKKELFMHCVSWSVDYLVKITSFQMGKEDMDLFDYMHQDVHRRLSLVREEKELSLFTQDVFLGKFRALTGESMEQMMQIADQYILNLIRNGQKKGTVRTDISEKTLALFLTGASMKMKEHILKEALEEGFDVTDERMEQFNSHIEDVVELLQNGMGSKEVL